MWPAAGSPAYWQMLEAIGTVCAAAVATIGLVYLEIVRPLMSRPSVSIRFWNAPPYSSLGDLILARSGPESHTSVARHIRVGIMNSSRTPARGIRVKLNRIATAGFGLDRSLIPYDLHWVDTRDTRREILGHREEAFVDLLVGVWDDPAHWWLQPYDFHHAAGFGSLAGLPTSPEPPFAAFIELVAYCENHPGSVARAFRIDYEEAENLGRFSMTAIPRRQARRQFNPHRIRRRAE